VIVGVAIAIVMELCGIKALSFAIGIYLPLSTTLPIFIGGAIRGLVDKQLAKRKTDKHEEEEEDLRKGNLFATGLVAGGALAGVAVAFLFANDGISQSLGAVNLEHTLSESLGTNGYYLLGTALFAAMTFLLYRVAVSRDKS
jgi:hypothetical protein